MIVRIGDHGSVAVEDVEVLDRFHVEASGLTMAAVVAALEAAGAGTGHSAQQVAVEPGFLRLAAGTSPSQEWQRGFDGMLGHARSRGWVDAAGGLLAHVEHLG